MKILELEIESIRGIKNKICLKPNGENIVIYGPNGSGKSAIVDAIEFLFTGNISRLSGQGSEGISLRNHGPHIDTNDPQSALIKAKIKFEGIDDPILLERSMARPKELICPEIEDEIFQQTLSILQKGRHVLSRSQILNYITATAGDRAKELNILLNLESIEERRRILGRIMRAAEKDVQMRKRNYEASVISLKTETRITELSEDELLKKINELRVFLRGDPIEILEIEKIKEGLTPHVEDEKERINPIVLKRTLDVINNLIPNKGLVTFNKEKELLETVSKLKDDKKLKKDLANKRLLDLGISLIDETGSCPLCLTEWKPGELEKFLRERLSKAEEADRIEKNINKLRSEIDTTINELKGYLTTIADMAGKLNQEATKKDVEIWIQKLSSWSDKLKLDPENYPTEDVEDEIKFLMVTTNWGGNSKILENISEKLEKFTPEQEAWDTLTKLQTLLPRYSQDKKEYQNSKKFSERASIISDTYTEVKDNILENLYESVNNDFINFYKILHGPDEDSFNSELKPEGPQIDFKVDFYGRGFNPPRALHSEGHQDSMGLCLYLALNKKLSEGKINVIILDDVVMSIDSGHRKNVCKLLKQCFQDKQFVITTHNRTWARQLSSDGVVSSKYMFYFKSWSLETGPIYAIHECVWSDIHKKLTNDEISSAAHQLREHLEFFYDFVCDSLRAKIRYKGDGRYELGDYLNGAKEAYKDYLKIAKSSANSWGDQELVEKFKNIESSTREIIDRTQLELWEINENVHFSRWGDFTKNDFLPVVEAFQDFEGLFKCPKCSGVISLTLRGIKPSSIKCSCGHFSWNLEHKA